MGLMAKRKNKSDDAPSSDQPEEGKRSRPPSRENTRYVGLPLTLYTALQKYAEDHSDEDTKKSASWAARVAIRRFLKDAGYIA